MKNKSLTIFGDGGSRGNPGKAAYGFVIFDEYENVVYKEGKRIGFASNNVAEYMAVVNSLAWIIKNRPTAKKIVFKLDSLLVASQLSGSYKVKHPDMKRLYLTVKELEKKLSAQIIYFQIPREENLIADSLVNDALDFKL